MADVIAEIIPDQLLLGSLRNVTEHLKPELWDSRIALLSTLRDFELEVLLNNPTPHIHQFFEKHRNQEPEGKSNVPSRFLHIDVEDASSPEEAARMMSSFESASNWIDQNISAGRIVVVHCRAGRSRSVTMAVAFLMLRRNMSLKAALEQVKKARPQALPNPAFMEVLLRLERRILFGAEDDGDATKNAAAEQKSSGKNLAPFAAAAASAASSSKTTKTPSFASTRDGLAYVTFLEDAINFSGAKKELTNKLLERALVYSLPLPADVVIEVEDEAEENNVPASIPMRASEVLWCPQPVQVGVGEFLRLSVDNSLEQQKDGQQQQPHRRMSVDDALAQYRRSVELAEADLSAKQGDGGGDDDEWEKNLGDLDDMGENQ